MNNKVSWQMIFDEFKSVCPRLARRVVDWYPTGQLEITIKLDDDTVLIFDYLSKRAKIVEAPDVPVRKRPTKIRPSYMTEREWKDIFSDNLCNKMDAARVSQKKLSDLTGISERTLRYYIEGDRIPSAYNLGKIAIALKCEISDLIE